ncbi:MAG: helix-turn-helix transcriptional regulator [Methylococcales bacterium]
MSQTLALIETLKKALKANGLTYRKVADELELSEASVKRLFAGQNISLSRLEQICQLMDLEISGLVKMMEIGPQITEFTKEQEKELVDNPKFLLVAFLVIHRCTFDDIVSNYLLTEIEIVNHLIRLDQLKIIELLPNNRIKLLISSNFSWRKNGPIQKYFVEHLQQDFLNSRFEEEGEIFYFFGGLLSKESREVLIKRIQLLADEFNELNRQDAQIPFDKKLVHGLYVAIRPWKPRVFDHLRR